MNQVTKKREEKNTAIRVWLMKCYVRMMMTLVGYELN